MAEDEGTNISIHVDDCMKGMRKLIDDNLDIVEPCDVCGATETFEVTIGKNVAGGIDHLLICINGHAEIF